MKMQQQLEFQPITLTIETGREAEIIWDMVREYKAKGPVEIALAVRLRLHVDHGKTGGNVSAWVMDTRTTSFDEDGNDWYAATRRAIVRAAAEIGKGKP